MKNSFDRAILQKTRLMEEIDSLDPDDKHYIKRKADLNDRLYKMYDKIEDTRKFADCRRRQRKCRLKQKS